MNILYAVMLLIMLAVCTYFGARYTFTDYLVMGGIMIILALASKLIEWNEQHSTAELACKRVEVVKKILTKHK